MAETSRMETGIGQWVEALAAAMGPVESNVIGLVEVGRVAYAPALALQNAIHARQRTADPGLGHVLLIVEHPPVFTRTKRTHPAHFLWDAAEIARRGATVADTDRGGDVTFHGPGQLVAYPLLNLHAFGLSASRYMHALEAAVLAMLDDFGIRGQREPGKTGVWVPQSAGEPSAKICAMGVRVSRGFTKHGLSVNLTTDLEWFSGIVPCGLHLPVTSVAREWALAGRPIGNVWPVAVGRLAETFGDIFAARVKKWSIAGPSLGDLSAGFGDSEVLIS